MIELQRGEVEAGQGSRGTRTAVRWSGRGDTCTSFYHTSGTRAFGGRLDGSGAPCWLNAGGADLG